MNDEAYAKWLGLNLNRLGILLDAALETGRCNDAAIWLKQQYMQETTSCTEI